MVAKKYEVQLSKNKNRQDKLIQINQAKDSLDEYDINYLKYIKETKNFQIKIKISILGEIMKLPLIILKVQVKREF